MRGSRGTTRVAVKVFKSRNIGNTRSNFLHEISMMAACRHPKIVPVLFVSHDTPTLCIVMPLMPNGSLEGLLQDEERRRRCLAVQRLRYGRDVFEGLAYLHTATALKKMIVHRDVKPDNILLHGDTAKLSDIGIAKELDRSMTMTAPMGTPLYMDPEYEATRQLSPASDVYSSGIVLFQLLAGVDLATLALAHDQWQGARGRWEHRVRTGRQEDHLDASCDWTRGEHRARARALHGLAHRCTEPQARNRPTSGRVRDQVAELVSEAGNEREAPRQSECIVCCAAPRQGYFQPCRHNSCCEPCAQRLINDRSGCPICRRAVSSFQVGNFHTTLVRD